jgi:NAD(P)-dependent dehydrogenase (short-subunit alcohol dehydrogenase family)
MPMIRIHFSRQGETMFAEQLMNGKRILVTGGGTGLGREIATRYLSLGADVYICGRRKETLEEAAAEMMAANGGSVKSFALDIRDPDAVEQMVQSIWEDGGALDGLVNNAAGNFISRTEDLSHRGFDAIANIVAHGTFYVTHSIGKRWVKEAREVLDQGGVPPTKSIVSILVTWIANGGPFVVPSAMSKAAVATMTKSLASEWGRYNIRLNGIAPGEFPTEGMNARLSPGQKTTGREVNNPMKRVGRMSELQNLATFLMADGVDWLTGQIITIDGANSLATGGNFYNYRTYTDEDWSRIKSSIKSQNAKDKEGRVANAE